MRFDARLSFFTTNITIAAVNIYYPIRVQFKTFRDRSTLTVRKSLW